jgi:hypothetical protein
LINARAHTLKKIEKKEQIDCQTPREEGGGGKRERNGRPNNLMNVHGITSSRNNGNDAAKIN